MGCGSPQERQLPRRPFFFVQTARASYRAKEALWIPKGKTALIFREGSIVTSVPYRLEC